MKRLIMNENVGGGDRSLAPAFTLSELLITLGIIGVVAALTMPSLIAHNKKRMIETRLRKVHSTMNQAVMLSIANETWTQPPTEKRNDNEALNEWMKTALFPYLSNIKTFKPNEINHPHSVYNSGYGIIFPDGSIMRFNNNFQISAFYDVNGINGPNKGGIDLFTFYLEFNLKNNIYAELRQNKSYGHFYPSGHSWGNDNQEDVPERDSYIYGNRDGMLKYCNPKYLNYDYENTCALLIMHDSWKISKDYPIKL